MFIHVIVHVSFSSQSCAWWFHYPGRLYKANSRLSILLCYRHFFALTLCYTSFFFFLLYIVFIHVIVHVSFSSQSCAWWFHYPGRQYKANSRLSILLCYRHFFALTLCYTSFFFFLLYIVFIHVIVHVSFSSQSCAWWFHYPGRLYKANSRLSILLCYRHFFALTLCYTSFFFFLLYIVFIHVIVHVSFSSQSCAWWFHYPGRQYKANSRLSILLCYRHFFALTLCYTSFFFFLLYIVFIHVIVHVSFSSQSCAWWFHYPGRQYKANSRLSILLCYRHFFALTLCYTSFFFFLL